MRSVRRASGFVLVAYPRMWILGHGLISAADGPSELARFLATHHSRHAHPRYPRIDRVVLRAILRYAVDPVERRDLVGFGERG